MCVCVCIYASYLKLTIRLRVSSPAADRVTD